MSWIIWYIKYLGWGAPYLQHDLQHAPYLQHGFAAYLQPIP